MDALDALQNRVSIAQLGEPAPDDATIETLLQAAIRAPDHGVLRPWRFIVLRGEDRNRLGDLLVAAKCEREPSLSEEERDKLRAKPLRAPLVLVAVAEVVEAEVVQADMASSSLADRLGRFKKMNPLDLEDDEEDDY